MSTTELKSLLRQAINYIQIDNDAHRMAYTDPATGKLQHATAIKVAATDLWLARARKAVAKPRGKR